MRPVHIFLYTLVVIGLLLEANYSLSSIQFSKQLTAAKMNAELEEIQKSLKSLRTLAASAISEFKIGHEQDKQILISKTVVKENSKDGEQYYQKKQIVKTQTFE